MFFVIDKSQCNMLDNLMKSTSSEFITFDFSYLMEIQLVTSDLSQLTIIKIEDAFFSDKHFDSISFTIPRMEFHRENMIDLTFSKKNQEIELKYNFKKGILKKTISIVSTEIFDMEFICKTQFNIELLGLEKIFKNEKELKFDLKNKIISGKYCKVKILSLKGECEFIVQADKFLKLCELEKYFRESYIGMTEDQNTINILLKSNEITMSSFLAVS